MKLTDDKIQLYLQSKYDYLCSKYSASNILGAFIVGIANYGFADSKDKITTVAIYVPSFEDLCTKPAADWIENNIYIIDIRQLYDSLKTCRWGALELLYTNYMKITPMYESLFNSEFMNNREIISRANQKNRMEICYKRMINSFHEGNYFEVARLLIATDLYLLNCNCEDIFHLKKDYHIRYLNNIKTNNQDLDLCQMKNNIDEFGQVVINMKNEKNIEADKIIKNGIISIINTGLNKKVSIDAFYSNLSKTETLALKEILNRLDINGIGNISISKIVEETGISRPVYKNLFIKLEKDNIALINNQGVKGTFIKLNMSLFN